MTRPSHDGELCHTCQYPISTTGHCVGCGQPSTPPDRRTILGRSILSLGTATAILAAGIILVGILAAAPMTLPVLVAIYGPAGTASVLIVTGWTLIEAGRSR